MSNPNYRIPDDMAAEVLAEAARLHAEANKGYSFTDLQQACSEAQIPSHIIGQALRNVEGKRSNERTKRRQEQEDIKKQVKRGIFLGIALLIPALAVSNIFIFRSHFKPVISELLFRLHLTQQIKTLTVEQDKLKYLTDPKGLSITISSVNGAYDRVQGRIGTDGYESLDIHGSVGDVYEYKGIYNYVIKIIEVGNGILGGRSYVRFQIEQQGQQPQSAVKRLEKNVVKLKEEVQQLQEQREKLQVQMTGLQQEGYVIKKQLELKNKKIEGLQQENIRLELQKSSNQL